ncbi:MAG: hypothetical protein Ta2A_05620 [Treponemataceae bacterium]|nr:MAG: hypothetical protein Ta2A_05620 [Treponemataceae bacterium]
MTTNINSLSAYSYNNALSIGVGGGTSGKLFVPVQPAQVVYAQFDHIAGVPTQSEQEGGVSISKIRILNSLINQLVSMKQASGAEKFNESRVYDDEQIESLIKDYQDKLTVALKQAENNPYAQSAAKSEPGMVFDVKA